MNEHDLSDAVTVKLLQEHCTITINLAQSVSVGRSINEKETSSTVDRTLRMNAET